MHNFDAIVIGAGNAGLAAATSLQRSGVQTLLLERHNIPGGCATSFVRGDFEFEVALHQLSGLGTEKKPFIMRQVFAQLGVMDKVEFIEEHTLYRFVVEGEIDITLPASWTGLKKELQCLYPAESDAIGRFLKLCEQVSMEYFLALPKATKAESEQALAKACPNYSQYGLRSSKSVLDEFFSDDQLKTVISAYWVYLGAPPTELLFSDLATLLYVYAAFKPWHIKGGSQAMSNALVESFLEAGGELKFSCPVEKIVTQDGQATGVVIEGGEFISSHAVVSNASPILTFNELLDIEAPAAITKDFHSRRMGPSAFAIYLGLDCTPAELGITSASSFIAKTSDHEQVYAAMSSLQAPMGGMLTCYSHEDPDAAPAGKSQVVLVCLQYGEVWRKVAAQDYAATKQDFAEQLIQLIETSVPNIREHIEEMEIATPLTMMRYLNTPGGAIYGFKQNVQDSSLLRGRMDDVPGLYMVGSWTGPGGFQPTYMAGQSVARRVKKQIAGAVSA